MFALLQLPTSARFGYFCVVAGFLVIIASVVFVIKGKATLGEPATPNTLEWGKIRASLTSVIALFVVGAALVFVPFWQVQREEASLQEEQLKAKRFLDEQLSKRAAHALLTGSVTAFGERDIRVLLVVEPDGEQSFRDKIMWNVPLLNESATYRVYYLDGDTIVRYQPLYFDRAEPGSDPKHFELDDVNLQLKNSVAKRITPEKEVSDEQLKSLGIR